MRDDDQANLTWRRSTACWNNNCVVVAARDGQVLVRDTSDSAEITLVINTPGWTAFAAQIRDRMGGKAFPPT